MLNFRPEPKRKMRVLSDCVAQGDLGTKSPVTAGTLLVWYMTDAHGNCVLYNPRDSRAENGPTFTIPRKNVVEQIDGDMLVYAVQDEMEVPLDEESPRLVFLQVREEVVLLARYGHMAIVDASGQYVRVPYDKLERIARSALAYPVAV